MLTSTEEEFFIRIHILSEYLFSMAYCAENIDELIKKKGVFETEIEDYFLQFPEIKTFLQCLEKHNLVNEYKESVQNYFKQTYSKDNYRHEDKLKKAYYLTKHFLEYRNLQKML